MLLLSKSHLLLLIEQLHVLLVAVVGELLLLLSRDLCIVWVTWLDDKPIVAVVALVHVNLLRRGLHPHILKIPLTCALLLCWMILLSSLVLDLINHCKQALIKVRDLRMNRLVQISNLGVLLSLRYRIGGSLVNVILHMWPL